MDAILNPLKKGMIILWSGLLAEIPIGWVRCNGENGTPDLRNKFIMGMSGIDNIGETGGLTTHTHTADDEGHDHIIESGEALQEGSDFDAGTTTDGANIDVSYSSNIPPYYVLAYIMKL